MKMCVLNCWAKQRLFYHLKKVKGRMIIVSVFTSGATFRKSCAKNQKLVIPLGKVAQIAKTNIQKIYISF